MAWTPESLPTIPITEGLRSDKTAVKTTIYAADADADVALITVAPRWYSFVIPATGKKLTGHIDAPYREDAFATIAATVGANIPPLAGVSKAARVDFSFAAVPARDVLRILGEVGNVSIVVGGAGELPALDIHARNLPWDVVLVAVSSTIGRSFNREKSTYFLLPPDTKVPPVDKKLPAARVDLVADGATVAQIATALRAIAPLKVGACATTPVSLRMRHATVAEVVRAVELVSGARFSDAAPCPSTALASEPVAELKARVFASAGIKHVVVFDHGGAIVTGTVDHKRIEHIGRDLVTFVGEPPTESAPTRPAADEAWRATLERTSALLQIGDKRSALIVRAGVTYEVSAQQPGVNDPETITYDIAQWGVHVHRDGHAFRTLPLAPAN